MSRRLSPKGFLSCTGIVLNLDETNAKTMAVGEVKWMNMPSVLDRVRIKGNGRVFLVVRVDDANGCADLVPWGGSTA